MLLNVLGRGHYVGNLLYQQAPSDVRWILEGDDIITVNLGKANQSILNGTGSLLETLLLGQEPLAVAALDGQERIGSRRIGRSRVHDRPVDEDAARFIATKSRELVLRRLRLV